MMTLERAALIRRALGFWYDLRGVKSVSLDSGSGMPAKKKARTAVPIPLDKEQGGGGAFQP